MVIQLQKKNEALELKVQQQEQLLFTMKDEIKTISEYVPSNFAIKRQSTVVDKSIFPRTCREVHAADPSLSSGMHWIDPDGQGVGEDPIYVYCDMTKGLVIDCFLGCMCVAYLTK